MVGSGRVVDARHVCMVGLFHGSLSEACFLFDII